MLRALVLMMTFGVSAAFAEPAPAPDAKPCACKEGGECKCGEGCKCKEAGACKCGEGCKCQEEGKDCGCQHEGGACGGDEAKPCGCGGHKAH